MKKIVSTMLTALLILMTVTAAASLKPSYKIGDIEYRDPETIYLSDQELSATVSNTHIVLTQIADSTEAQGETTVLLTDMRYAPELVTEKKTVIYTFDGVTSVSGIRIIRDAIESGIVSGKVSGSYDGSTWFDIGELNCQKAEISVTDFGFNMELTKIAITFTECDKSKITLYDMHIIKGVRGYETVKPGNIDASALYKNGTETKNFKITADTELKNNKAIQMLDGSKETFWHSGYTVTNGKAVPDKELPYTVTVDFGGELSLSGIRYVPRNGGSKVTKVAVYGSSDGKDYYKIAESGTWKYEGTESKDILFGENYYLASLKFIVLETEGNIFATGAEIEFFKRKMEYSEHRNADEVQGTERLSWTVTAEGNKEAAFDGNNDTSWELSQKTATLTMDFGRNTNISGIRYSSTAGMVIKEADILISEDGINYKKFCTADFSKDNQYLFRCNLSTKAMRLEIKKISGNFSIDEITMLASSLKFSNISLSEELEKTDSWTASVSSFAPYAPAGKILDDDINTYWHSYHDNTGAHDAPPIDVIVDFGGWTEISGFDYYPRRDDATGFFKSLDIYISSYEDADGAPVWEYIESKKYSYSDVFSVQKTEFNYNYNTKRIKLHVTEGNAGYVTGAEIKFLKARANAVPKSAEFVHDYGTFDFELMRDVDIAITMNDAGKIVNFIYGGEKVDESYYKITENGITLSKYFFVDFDSNTALHDTEFKIDFLRGNSLDYTVKVGGSEVYTVTYKSVGNGRVTAEAVNGLGVARNLGTGDTVKKGEEFSFTATPEPGFDIEAWTVKNSVPKYEKIEDRTKWIVTASTWASSPSNIIDGKDDTYWHSGYSVIEGIPTAVEEKDKKPYYITVKFPQEINASGITLLPRQGYSSSTAVTSYELYKSTDGVHYDVLIGSGTVAYSSNTDDKEKMLMFNENQTLDGVQLKIINTRGGWGCIAELNVLTECASMTGTLTEKGTVSQKFVIDDMFTDADITVTFKKLSGNADIVLNMDNIGVGANITSTEKGKNLVMELSAEDGYDMPPELSVKSDGTVLRKGLDYIYEISEGTGRLTIYNVNGKISVEGAATDHNLYTVTYKDTHGAIGSVPAAYKLASGKIIKLDKCTAVLSGYTFGGWKNNDNGNIYKAGAEFVMPTHNVVFEAYWTKSNDKKPAGGGGAGGGGGIAITGTASSEYTVNISGKGEQKLAVGSIIAPPEAAPEGYAFAGWYLDEALTEEYENRGLRSNVTLYPAWLKLRSREELLDINGHWAKDAIGEMYEKYIVNGKSGNSFDPDTIITRAEFVQILFKYSGMPTAKSINFDDVKTSDWFALAVSWAVKNGITTGTGDNLFSPQDGITREQMATMLMRYARLFDSNITADGETDFIDEADISWYAKEAVKWAKHKGVVAGNPDNSFAPQKNATRAEAVTMISRLK